MNEPDWAWKKDPDTGRGKYRYAVWVTRAGRTVFVFAYPLEDGYRLRVSGASMKHLYMKEYNGGREAALRSIETHLRRIS